MRPRSIPSASAERIRDVLREGFRYVRRRVSLMQAVLTGFVIAYFGGALIHLAPGLAKVDFRVGETGLAGLITAAGAGSVAASLLIIRYGDYVDRSRMTRWGMACYGAAPLLIAVSTWYPLGLFGYFVTGVAHVTVAIAMNTTIQGAGIRRDARSGLVYVLDGNFQRLAARLPHRGLVRRRDRPSRRVRV